MKSPNIIQPFLTGKALEHRWSVCGMTLWRLRKAGRLTAYKLGKRGVRYSLAEVERIEAEAAQSEPQAAAA